MTTLKNIVTSITILAVFFFFAPIPRVQAAGIAFDTVTGGVTTATGNITVGSLTNGVVVVYLMYYDHAITAVSVNGVAGTQVLTSTASVLGDMWIVKVGTVSGSIPYSVTATGGVDHWNFSSYSGVDQTNPVQSSTQVSSTIANQSTSLTPTTDGTWAVVQNQTSGACAKTGLVNITNTYDTASVNQMQTGDSGGAITNGVSYTMTTQAACSEAQLNQMLLLAPATTASFNFWTFWDF